MWDAARVWSARYGLEVRVGIQDCKFMTGIHSSMECYGPALSWITYIPARPGASRAPKLNVQC